MHCVHHVPVIDTPDFAALVNHATVAQALDALVPAPFGFIGIRFEPQGPCLQFLQHAIHLHPQPDARALAVADLVNAYLVDPHTPLPELPTQRGTAFQQRVWQAMRTIPPGETRSYAELAIMVQSGPRAVANACGANPLPLFNPCHRVVASHGLGGFMRGQAAGLAIKRWLLNHENPGRY